MRWIVNREVGFNVGGEGFEVGQRGPRYHFQASKVSCIRPLFGPMPRLVGCTVNNAGRLWQRINSGSGLCHRVEVPRSVCLFNQWRMDIRRRARVCSPPGTTTLQMAIQHAPMK